MKIIEEEIKTTITQYEAVKRSGLTNMLDKHGVQRIASDNGLHNLVIAIAYGKYGEILKNYSEWIQQINEEDLPKVE